MINPKLNLPALPSGEFYQFHTMIKPTGSLCNIDCSYCFYLHKGNLLNQPKLPLMSDDVLEAHISQYIEAQTGEEVVFTWQGGEPTIAGVDYFKRVIELQNKYKKNNQRVLNDLQTNGILLDDEWCDFLKKHDFLVGLSIDGPEELHNIYRVNRSGKPTFDKVMNAVKLLHKHKVEFNALCVVNNVNSYKPLEVYKFIRDEVNPRIIQFIPCVEPKDFKSTAPQFWDNAEIPTTNTSKIKEYVTDWTVEPEQWGNFLAAIWDYWFNNDYGNVFVDQFENIISMFAGYGAQKCVNSPICGKAVAIENNGDIFSCDHFVYPEYKLGNIFETHEGELVFSEKQKIFAYNKYKTLPKYCQNCQYLKLCWGECPKTRFTKTPDGEFGLSYLCQGLKIFYARSLKDKSTVLKRLAE